MGLEVVGRTRGQRTAHSSRLMGTGTGVERPQRVKMFGEKDRHQRTGDSEKWPFTVMRENVGAVHGLEMLLCACVCVLARTNW